MKKMLLLLICLGVLLLPATPKEIQLTFSQSSEEQELLYLYFNGLTKNFFVDIGAFHPVDQSNTRILKNMGWKGINVDANYQRLKFFFGMNDEDLNLNYAIGEEESKEVSMFINENIPSKSTADEKFYGEEGFTRSMTIPTITLAELCQRFFIKKPVFLNLDVEGFSDLAVAQNNWKSSKCRPDIILAEENQWSDEEEAGDIRKILEEQGYQYVNHVGEDSLYIEQDKIGFYTKVAGRNKKMLDDGKVLLIDYNSTVSLIAPYLPSGSDLTSMFYNIFDSSVFLHFQVRGDNLDLDELYRYSDKIVDRPQLIGRPLLIYGFDPRRGVVVLNQDHTFSELVIDENNRYFVIEFQRSSRSYKVYIFNHYLVEKQAVKITNFQKINDGEMCLNVGLETITESAVVTGTPQITEEIEEIFQEQPTSALLVWQNYVIAVLVVVVAILSGVLIHIKRAQAEYELEMQTSTASHEMYSQGM